MERPLARRQKKLDFYAQMDKTWSTVEWFLNSFAKSEEVGNYVFKHYESLFYANVISNFFTNLTKENVREEGLPRGKITEIKSA